MQQSGEYRIRADRETVWQALNDPELLGECIAGCQSVSKIDDEHFDVAVKAKIGPVSAIFKAALELSDINPPESYVINGSAKGGAAGFAKGSAQVSLEEDGDFTVLRYGVEANVGGKLAQVGSRLVEGASRKMADDFFAAFSLKLDPESVPADAQGDTTTGEEASKGGGEAYEGSGQLKIWLIAFGVLILAAILAI